ncbi:MAG: CcdB family protein [Gammaproteobacteria bacterium]
MKQYAVYENKNQKTQKSVPYLLNIQADLLDGLQTCVVVPLIPADAGQLEPIGRLTPLFGIEGNFYLMLTPQLAGIAKRELGRTVADLSSARDEIIAAIDFLVTGF